ncbi:MAG TPA: YhbY family RNA-binding protein [Bryobacteraceae bacterium]|nr:YhbY family RNA-binding protein [Bryobacteraceae bacterium]
MSAPLTNAQRKHLRRLVHAATPAVQLGKNGMSPTFLQSLEAALNHHEVIKLRFANLQDERKELAAEIERLTGAALVSMVGYTAVFYRQNADPEKRKVVLPRSTRGSAAYID